MPRRHSEFNGFSGQRIEKSVFKVRKFESAFYFPTAKKDEGKPRPFLKFLFPSAEQPIDDPHQRSRKYAVDDNGSRHDEHFCRKPVNPALRLELDGGRTDAVCKPRNGHDRPRARVSAYPVVNAQSRQQRAEKNERTLTVPASSSPVIPNKNSSI